VVFVAGPPKKVSARHVRITFALRLWLILSEKRQKHDLNQVEGKQGENPTGN